MTRLVVAVMIGVLAGCASARPVPGPSATLLAQADRLVSDGEYAGALEVYGEILARYPDKQEAAHARTSRETVTRLVAARSQIARLTAEMNALTSEMKVLTSEMKAQEAELARARELASTRDGDLSRAKQEIARLTMEAEKLRADLEQLKRIDIDLERRRTK